MGRVSKLISALSAIAAIAGVMFLLKNPDKNMISDDPCTAGTKIAYGQFRCYTERARSIVKTKGIQAALAYTAETVRRDSIFSYAHMTLHAVGQEAYRKTGDVTEALAYLTLPSLKQDYFYYDDGFSHGVFQAYFFENKDKKTLAELVHGACGKYIDNPELVVSADNERWLPFRECFHGVGHALVFKNGYDVEKSLSQCDKLPHKDMREWCYYGAIMESSYLYVPAYESHVPRPRDMSTSMASLCPKLQKQHQRQCSNFVGRAYVQATRGDIMGGLKQCDLVDRRYRQGCIEHVAWLFIPMFNRESFSDMAEVCKTVEPKYQEGCIQAVAVGLGRGTGGKIENKEAFCDLTDAALKSTCLESLRNKVLPSDFLK